MDAQGVFSSGRKARTSVRLHARSLHNASMVLVDALWPVFRRHLRCRRHLQPCPDGHLPPQSLYRLIPRPRHSGGAFLPKKAAKNCEMRQLRQGLFYGIMLTYRRGMPTPQNRHIALTKRRINPSDSRCGSVETFRNSASVSLRCGENAREMVGAFRVATQWQV